MFQWQRWLGALLGLIAGGALLQFTDVKSKTIIASGAILSECDGRIRELAIQYEPSAKEIVTSAYRDFIRALDAEITVHVVCPDLAAFSELASAVGSVSCRLSPIVVNHAMTTLARDRWVALAPASTNAPTTLWSPRAEDGDVLWAARAGDERIGADIAKGQAPAVVARRSSFYFDGGDFLADSDHVFVMPRVLQRNLQHTAHNREQFLSILAAELKRNVILLDEAPDHHAGMFMASVGAKTMLVADPGLAKQFTPDGHAPLESEETNEFMRLPGGPDFSSPTQQLFDAVASQCSAAGYRVIRIPTVPARDGRTYLTYLNVLIDRQADRRIVYLPFYRGVESMNAAARVIWESLGYEVRAVDCTDTYLHYGSLHCLVNVLRRD